jgi:CheY-like chemotaxis protein
VKILVVDDDRVVADLVMFTVRRAGYEAIMASDAASALRRWSEGQPDLILLDINLPARHSWRTGSPSAGTSAPI